MQKYLFVGKSNKIIQEIANDTSEIFSEDSQKITINNLTKFFIPKSEFIIVCSCFDSRAFLSNLDVVLESVFKLNRKVIFVIQGCPSTREFLSTNLSHTLELWKHLFKCIILSYGQSVTEEQINCMKKILNGELDWNIFIGSNSWNYRI